MRSLEKRQILFKGTTRKISQKGGLLNFLAPLTRVALPLTKKYLSLARRVLAPLRLIAAASATDTAIQKKIFGSWVITLII